MAVLPLFASFDEITSVAKIAKLRFERDISL